MSYPDLGCFAECLECELCDDSWLNGDDELDLDLDLDFDDWTDDPGWWDPAPEGDEDGLFDDFEIPGVDLPGGGRATPSWNNGPGIQLEWPW